MNDKATILAVDDSPESLMMLAKMLTPAGYQVRSAASGELALAAVAANAPDLVLLDIHLDGIDGLEVCRRLKAREETQHIPIILISAFAGVEEWVEGLQLGAVDYITKPFQTAELLTRVKTHLALSQAENKQQQLESQLRQAQKMEAIGRLAGGIAHDFNNMLGVILGRAEVAMKRLNPTDPLYSHLQEIMDAAQRSANITKQLLAFSRRQPVNPKPLNLNDTVAENLKMIQRLLGEEIDVHWKPADNLWLVLADPSQADQILLNLAANARDAIVAHGEIMIETANAVLDETACADHTEAVPGEYVCLVFRDTGTGISQEAMTHLFEPFFTTKELGKGTGLGLATVHGIVKQNNGIINVGSELGHGTTFKIYWPRFLSNSAISAMPPAEQSMPQQGQETILLVEDEQAVLELTMEFLAELGYNVMAANTPGQAIRLATEHAQEISVLLTDVIMPEMNGYELSKLIMAIRSEIKCLYMSGYTANAIAIQNILDEGGYFIEKPFSMNDLGNKIRTILNQQRK